MVASALPSIHANSTAQVRWHESKTYSAIMMMSPFSGVPANDKTESFCFGELAANTLNENKRTAMRAISLIVKAGQKLICRSRNADIRCSARAKLSRTDSQSISSSQYFRILNVAFTIALVVHLADQATCTRTTIDNTAVFFTSTHCNLLPFPS
ncbi:hypothetical protein P692DRAFT_201811274 [Suillus brevipes Sb2]|nr:hypothetical protein P692DRAFT_201811274 [Suillus brevipes Sb2]